jgi:hypothetical protein
MTTAYDPLDRLERSWYELGFFDGFARGYEASEREMADAWHAVWAKTRDVLAQPTFAELDQRRTAPEAARDLHRGAS